MADGSRPNLVALRERRKRTIDILTEHFSRDNLDMEEFEDRVDKAHGATSIATLDQLVSDLEPVEAAESTQSTALAPLPKSQALDVARPERKKIVAIMGGVSRKGPWVVPSHLNVLTVMGGAELDFRDAVLPPGVTEIKVRSVMGGVAVLVPPHVAVEADGIAIMGGFADMHRAPPTPDPEQPLLRITGFAVMGGLAIETRLPGESHGDAHRRERRERRKLRKRERDALRDNRRNALGSGKRKELGSGSDED